MHILGDVGVDGEGQCGVGKVSCVQDGFGEQHPVLGALVGKIDVILEFRCEAEVEAHVGCQDCHNDNLAELLLQKQG